MHESSYEKMEAFVRVHLESHRGQPLEILDFGSQVVDDQGVSYRGLFDDPKWNYNGLDIEDGHNVDIVVADAYNWTEVESDSIDLVISGQAFEHVQYFWASMYEIVRTLRPGGLVVIIAPSGGFEHRYPVDCWRFYRDGFVALCDYVGCELVDAFTDWGHLDWEDSILIARKPKWDREGLQHFFRRSLLQRALLDDGTLDFASLELHWHTEVPATAMSVLRSVEPGALTTVLETARDERDAAASDAAAAAAAAADRQVTELNELRAHVAALHDQPGPTLQLYGNARRRIAGLAGDRGRRLYKRLRGRT